MKVPETCKKLVDEHPFILDREHHKAPCMECGKFVNREFCWSLYLGAFLCDRCYHMVVDFLSGQRDRPEDE